MKKYLVIAFLIGLILCVIGDCYINYNAKKAQLYDRVNELHEIGYSLQASQKIARVELGFEPMDKEYQGLIED